MAMMARKPQEAERGGRQIREHRAGNDRLYGCKPVRRNLAKPEVYNHWDILTKMSR